MKLSDKLKTSCKNFSIKLFTVFCQGSWTKFYERVSCEQKKKIQYNLWHKN